MPKHQSLNLESLCPNFQTNTHAIIKSGMQAPPHAPMPKNIQYVHASQSTTPDVKSWIHPTKEPIPILGTDVLQPVYADIIRHYFEIKTKYKRCEQPAAFKHVNTTRN
ncbi:hypothetical protein L249_7196, partial [Ophiocordyceps polyrhachis-furcata BCC 54312]